MTRRNPANPSDAHASKPPRQARLQALLFTGAALGTTLLTLGATVEPKLPPYKGE